MKVGVWYDSVEETLCRTSACRRTGTKAVKGFLTYDTDGRLPKAPAAKSNPVSIM